MKILLTGATGYIGRRLLPVLVDQGHHVVCPVRDKRRFDWDDFTDYFLKHVTVIEADFTDRASLKKLPGDVDAAYYLLHSLGSVHTNFHETEQKIAKNFNQYLSATQARQVIYLGGISNDEDLSEHLSSRKDVEERLKEGEVPVTVFRAAIIIGSGSASFEIIRDLVEKLPVMVAPKWLKSRCQPIAVYNVIQYLTGVLLNEGTFDKTFDIGGPDILSYKEMLMRYAHVRNLKRFIITLPVLTPRLSSLWLYFVTSTSYLLARNLVDSMKNEVVCQEESIKDIIPLELFTYEKALERAFNKIEQKNVISSWKDAIYNQSFNEDFLSQINVPTYGCFKDEQKVTFQQEPKQVLDNVWSIGGKRGWYYGHFLWEIRGFLDKLVGGVGLRRGRRDHLELRPGDSLDFWRVLLADKRSRRLLLYAEMKLPGEAWLEFKVDPGEDVHTLCQTATFRPLGLWGRIYWYMLIPFHTFIFRKMAKNIVHFSGSK